MKKIDQWVTFLDFISIKKKSIVPQLMLAKNNNFEEKKTKKTKFDAKNITIINNPCGKILASYVTRLQEDQN